MKKYSLIFTTLIGWIVTTFVLYYTQYKIYGGTIETIWRYVLIFIPVLLISNFLISDDNKFISKTNKVFYFILNAAAFLIILWCIFISPYDAITWNVVWIAIMSLMEWTFKSLKKKLKNKNFVKERCVFVILTYIFLIVEPFVFAAITGAKTVNNVQNILTEQGYENVAYIGSVSKLQYINLLFETNVKLETKNKMELKTYIFTSQDNGIQTAISVSVISGRILSSVEVEKNSPIELYISQVSK